MNRWSGRVFFLSLPARNEWGESWREGNPKKKFLLSATLSSLLCREELEKGKLNRRFMASIRVQGPPRPCTQSDCLAFS
jgi:hypothetical protein